ncbi:MAG: head-tail connector protein [Candidatus Odyssella sp.]|nr:head-tail connector protein [Candidatus Odyssella sp.]
MSDARHDPIAAVRRRFERARAARGAWETLWQECYEFALPPAQPSLRMRDAPGSAPPLLSSRLFDGTAPDAVDQLAASLLARLTPPWSRWFGLAAGRDLAPDEQQKVGPELEAIAETLQSHFDRSNFAVEIHQCYLDLAAAGTACLLFEEAPLGADSAFRFAAVPLAEAWLEEGARGRLDTVFRRTALRGEEFRTRFPKAALDADAMRRIEAGEEVNVDVIEAVLPEPDDREGFRYVALRDGGGAEIAADDGPLAEGRFQRSPFIAFRWLKAPGEAYGRSPVMKALPDIKTANKVVELVLKNASIAVTGIWQAEDDGVLNPANIKLVPGSIIPKAVGSAGLTPLEAPGKFDVSQLVLEDLRARIRHALMADALAQIDAPRMTATEVLERSAEMSRILGATYGRLQSELLTPLIQRGLAILRRRREIPDIVVDGRIVALQYRSPLAQDQAKEDARNVVSWIEMTSRLGPEAGAVVDGAAAGRWLARTLGVPAELVKPAPQAGGAAPGADLAGLLGNAASALPELADLLKSPGALGALAPALAGSAAPPVGNKTGSTAEAADVA